MTLTPPSATDELLGQLLTRWDKNPDAPVVRAANPLQERLDALGITKTVYSLELPSTVDLRWELRQPKHWVAVSSLTNQAWTKKQDLIHHVLFDTWLEWTQPVLAFNSWEFPNRYPSAGSSEAIREVIAHFATHHVWPAAKRDELVPRIHVFRGEYEGYRAYADAYGVQVMEHDRDNWQQDLSGMLEPNDIFLISHPSAIDGNLWPGFGDWLIWMDHHFPTVRVGVDLCYVGCVGKTYGIRLLQENVHWIFFSLSKVFGVYYDRIGGVLSRDEIPGLFGNMWFKNLQSIFFGTKLIENAPGVMDHAARFQEHQQIAVESLQRQLMQRVYPSDVFLLAHHSVGDHPTGLDQHLRRANTVRYCLTPRLDGILNT